LLTRLGKAANSAVLKQTHSVELTNPTAYTHHKDSRSSMASNGIEKMKRA
jgi:hypothetical protein